MVLACIVSGDQLDLPGVAAVAQPCHELEGIDAEKRLMILEIVALSVGGIAKHTEVSKRLMDEAERGVAFGFKAPDFSRFRMRRAA